MDYFSVLTLLQAQDVWQMPDYQCYMKYTYFPSQDALEEVRSQRDPKFFAFTFRSPGYYLSLSFCPVLLLYKAAAGFWNERHLYGSLQRVTELSKSLVLKTYSFSMLYPILRWWSKGSELREKLKVVCFGVNNNTNPQTLMRLFLGLSLMLIPESRHIIISSFEKCLNHGSTWRISTHITCSSLYFL